MRIASCWSLAADYCLLAAGCRLLTAAEIDHDDHRQIQIDSVIFCLHGVVVLVHSSAAARWLRGDMLLELQVVAHLVLLALRLLHLRR